MTDVQFFFETNGHGSYVGVLSDSAYVSGAIVSQNAGSTNETIYYQVGGEGLNGAFASALSGQLDTVNEALRAVYDARHGDGRWQKDKQWNNGRTSKPPSLTSFLIPVRPTDRVGNEIVGMMYSVGPQLTSEGLTEDARRVYTQIYLDALEAIAASAVPIAGFRVTMLSSGIYRGGAPIAPFAKTAAGCIIDAVVAAARANPEALGSLSILINTDDQAGYPKERLGFTSAATARGATVTDTGFAIAIT